MRFVGIDVAAERHVVAVVDESDRVLIKATPFTEDGEGYAKLLGTLGGPTDALVAMEATGHYWKNLFAALVAAGFAVALLNPLRTRRFAGSARRSLVVGERAGWTPGTQTHAIT
jgi:transposase